MKRRQVLALLAAGAVPLAGCSGDGGDGGNESSGGTDGSDVTDGATNTTDTTGNATDDVDETSGGNQTDGVDDEAEDTGGDADGQTDEQSDGQSDGSDEPSEEALAQEDVDAAQAVLSDAVAELESQGTNYGALDGSGQGPPVTAAVDGLSAGPVRDQLSSVQGAIDDAREHDLTGDQADVLDAIEAAKDWLHSVLDAHDPLNSLYLEAHYAAQDWAAEGNDPDLQAVQRAADQAQSPVDDVTSPYNAVENTGVLESISESGFEAQRDRIQTDLESGRAVRNGIEQLQDAADLFWPNRERYRNEAKDDIVLEEFESAQQGYGSAEGSTGEIGGSFGAASSYLSCVAGNMQTAADEYHSATGNYWAENYNRASEYAQAAEAAIEDAEGCSLDWSGGN